MGSVYDTEYLAKARHLGRIGGALSILGSSYIIQNVLRDPKKKRKIVDQVVVALSFADLFSSFFNGILSQWPAPKGAAKGAIGNVGTCVASSFFGGVGFLSSTYFNASLAIIYLLMIKYGWKEERLQKSRIYFMGLPLLFSFPFIVTGIAMGGGNFNGVYCGALIPEPAWCDSDPSTCTRGAKLVQMPVLVLLGATLQTIISIPIVVGCMILLYLAVLKIEKRNDQYRFDGEMNREQSKRTAIQGIYYVWAFLLVEVIWVAIVVITVLQKLSIPSLQKFGLAPPFIITSQGFFNALVYLRPTYLEYLRKNPEKTISNRIRRLFGWEVQLLEPNHCTKMSSKGTGYNFKKSSDVNSGSDPVFTNPGGNYNSRLAEEAYQGPTQGSVQISSPLVAAPSESHKHSGESGWTNSLVVSISATDSIPEEQQEEQKYFEEDDEASTRKNDNNNNSSNCEERTTKNNDGSLATKSPSFSPVLSSSSSSTASSPIVTRLLTDFTGSIVNVDSDHNND